jgi:hypothetical protein
MVKKNHERMCHGTQMPGTQVYLGALVLSFQTDKQDAITLAGLTETGKYRSFLAL